MSRVHANIKYTNNSIFIKDNKSKFGTLKLLKNNNIKYKDI